MADSEDKLEFQDEEAAAIKALGSLFKLTEVHFWVDVSTGVPNISKKMVEDDAICSSITDDSSLPIDTELSRQMNELGLPLSFRTNKESQRKSGKVRGKRRDTDKMFLHTHEGALDEVFDSIKNHTVDIPVGNNQLQASCDGGEYSTDLTAAVSSSADGKDIFSDLVSDVQLTNDQECDSVNSTICSRDDMKFEATSDDVNGGMSNDMPVIHNHGKKQENGGLEENIEGPLVPVRRDEDSICSYKDIDLPQEPDAGAHSTCCDEIHSEVNDQLGDWMAYWDPFYARNYFYNSKTQQSTWEPPPGMESLAFGDVVVEQKEMAVDMPKMDVNADITNDDCKERYSAVLQRDLDHFDGMSNDRSPRQLCNELFVGLGLAADGFDDSVDASTVSCCPVHLNEPLEVSISNDESSLFVFRDTLHPAISSSDCRLENTLPDEFCNGSKEHGGNMEYELEKLDTELDVIPNKRKTKVRRTRSRRKLSVDIEEVQLQVFWEEFSPIMSKYWWQRNILFSKYSEGIKMDEEGWFSVTPEPIAKHHALRCGGCIIVDCFTGVGGNAIQFAQTSTQIIAIDIDPKKIEYAHHNAAIYGVKDRIEFIIGDCVIVAKKLKADTVFLSPPWGGPQYVKAKNFDINTMLKPFDGQFLFNVAKAIAPKIVMFLPRNVDINQLAELSLSADPPWSLEVEKNFLNGKLKAITAYFSDPSFCN